MLVLPEKFDSILLSQVRLGVITVLMTRGAVTFSELRGLLGLTQGNLGGHLHSLEKASYIEVDKEFVDKKPRTTVRITDVGRRAFLQHVELLAEIARREPSR